MRLHGSCVESLPWTHHPTHFQYLGYVWHELHAQMIWFDATCLNIDQNLNRFPDVIPPMMRWQHMAGSKSATSIGVEDDGQPVKASLRIIQTSTTSINTCEGCMWCEQTWQVLLRLSTRGVDYHVAGNSITDMNNQNASQTQTGYIMTKMHLMKPRPFLVAQQSLAQQSGHQ